MSFGRRGLVYWSRDTEQTALLGGEGRGRARGQRDHFDVLPGAVEEVREVAGPDQVRVACSGLQQKLAGAAVAGYVDDVPASGLFEYVAEAVAGDAVLQDADIDGFPACGNALDELDEFLPLTAQV